MCGIFGIINSSNSAIDKQKVKEAALLMKHRGPNAYGQRGITSKIELAHVRLAIIDLSEDSNQPFISSCGNYVIVFNGEIYNYVEIKEELIAKGYAFRTLSDTEVLLNSFIEWGTFCVSKFNGDWAFAIYNCKNNSLFCSRDRYGVKPFNYAIIEDQFVFASEIKSIINYFPQLKKPNYNVISNYCRNSLGAQIEQSWFENVKRLLPAHNLIWENGKIKIEKYWSYPTSTFKNISFENALEEYSKLFYNAVKLRMRSDVPVGTTLSSGLDSTSIASVLRQFETKNHKTFTAVFDDKDFIDSDKIGYKEGVEVNEKELVKKFTSQLQLEAHLIPVDNANFVEYLSKTIYHLESGHSSHATIPLYRVMEYAKKHVVVVLEGQGADELLSGYVIKSLPFLLYELVKRGQFNEAYHEFSLFAKSYSLSYTVLQFFRMLNSSFIERLYHYKTGIHKLFAGKLKNYTRIKDYPIEPPSFSEKFNEELYKQHTGGLVNLLHYGDALSMSGSLESRNPFTDVNLVEYVFQLPFHFKMRNGFGKYIHRVAMKGIVPDMILNNPLKFGFSSPLSIHFESKDSEAVKILLSERCLKRGLFNEKELKKLLTTDNSLKKDNAAMLFRFLSVELWFRCFIDEQ